MDVDLFKPLNLCFKVFRALGLWQDDRQSWRYFIYGYALHIIFIYGQLCLQVNYAVHATDMNDLIDTVGMLTAFLGTAFKYLLWLFNMKDIVKLVETLRSDLKFSEDARLRGRRGAVGKQSRIVFRVYCAFWGSAIMSCTTSILTPILQRKQPFPTRYPFETNPELNPLGFWLSSYYSVFNMYIVSAMDISLNTLPVILMAFVIGMLSELRERLSDFGEADVHAGASKESRLNQRAQYDELIKCIEIHKRIKKLSSGISQQFGAMFFVQGFLSSLILCVSAFSLSLVRII